MDGRPIGVFDSGLGGLTVVRQLLRRLPGENIVYFGDTGRVPYGNRSRKILHKYARQDCSFLRSKGVKLIIAACGTVSSVVPRVLEEQPVPAFGVVKPAAAAAVRATRSGRIGVLGTSATIHAGAFRRCLLQLNPQVQVFEKECPLFVALVENGWIGREDEVTRLTARRYLEPLREQGVDTLILGCTHFPLLTDIIADIMGGGVTLIDSGQAAADACVERLAQDNTFAPPGNSGRCHFYVSDQPEGFSKIAGMFLGQAIGEHLHTVDLELPAPMAGEDDETG
ncbi:MAG: glutamate racemase [Clostridiales bacterium]|nr:glutamate racemase [Clostridiales bacterium]